ncbi:MAG: 5'-nucleotidase [Defluviicoccus sp.]|nr:5'-nucleotidase [Defluviicoccus sp.]MDE0275737.1 5'-nucleotidase [Defluviicoccus sp.]
MPYLIEDKLVIAVSSTALFDFSAEHDLYLKEGVDQFRSYQRDNRTEVPQLGTAFPFIQRILQLNTIYSDHNPIEVVILSRNHADAGLRVMDAVRHYELSISRAFFLAGSLPYPYMESVGAVLYLSTNKDEVNRAIADGFPAGYVLPCENPPIDDNRQLRIAFDFDGVIADDEAEIVYQEKDDLDLFHEHERRFRNKPLQSGPLMPLLRKISALKTLERHRVKNMKEYTEFLRIAIVTARNAPAHERLIKTLADAGLDTDELFLLGGIEKKKVLDVLKPHIFFDDQIDHLQRAAASIPSVHIPFGIANYGGK